MANKKDSTARPMQSAGRPAIPAEFAMDEVLWAAWMYYEQGQKQEDIAGTLGISRASVFNLLQKARDERIVNISIDPTRMSQASLALKIKDLYGLEACYVLPVTAPSEPIHNQIGRLGARVLEQLLRPNDTIGVAWGRTVLAMSQHLQNVNLPNVTIAQVTGSSAATFAFSPPLCTSNIAERLNARCVNLHAPGIVSSPDVKRIFMAEPSIRTHFALLSQCTKLLFGVTPITGPTLLVEGEFMTEIELQAYRDLGAVGFACGYFYDADGAIVRTEFDGRHITMPLEELREVPQRICVGGGPGKADSVRAMLKAGLATILVTDDQTARAVMARQAG